MAQPIGRGPTSTGGGPPETGSSKPPDKVAALGVEILKPYTFDSGEIAKCIKDYCEKYQIIVPEDSSIDFGAQLLMRGSNILVEAAKKGEAEVVQRLLETNTRGGNKYPEWCNDFDARMRWNFDALLRDFDQLPKEISGELLCLLLDSEIYGSIIRIYFDRFSTSYDKNIFTNKLLRHVFSVVKQASIEEVGWNQRFELAKIAIERGANDRVIKELDSFMPEADRSKFFQWLIEKGEIAAALDHIEKMGTDSLNEGDWIHCLEAAKNHIRGVELAGKIPEKFKSERVNNLIQDCEESHRALEKIRGYIWNPVSRVPDPESGGYFIVFEEIEDLDTYKNPYFEDRSDRAAELEEKHFPADELSQPRLWKYLDHPMEEIGMVLQPGTRKRICLSPKSTRLIVPDVRVVQHRYDTLREGNPNLPKLSIYSSEGILSDKEFLEKQFDYDFICSADKEFLHDMLVHLTTTLITMYQNPKFYTRYKKLWTLSLKEAKSKLDKYATKYNLDPETKSQLDYVLAVKADIYSGTFHNKKPLSSVNESVIPLEELVNSLSGGYLNILERRHGDRIKNYLSAIWMSVLNDIPLVKAKEGGGYLTLHLSALEGNIGEVNTVLEAADRSGHLADVLTAKNEYGETALDIARKEGHTEIVEILENALKDRKFNGVRSLHLGETT